MSNIVPAIGKPAPQFKGMAVVNGEFKEISLADYKGKYVVFFFYPLDFTFVCPTEIIAFSDRVKEFRDIGVEVIGCSTDSHFSHFAWINTPRKQGGLGNMDIPLLADKNCSVAKSYGVYLEEEGVTFRGLFIIDPKQNLRQVTINDLPVGRSVDETLRLVQAFQFTDKHGEDRRAPTRSQEEIEEMALHSEDAPRNAKRMKQENTCLDNAVNLVIVKSESDPDILGISYHTGESDAGDSFIHEINTSGEELGPSSSGSVLNWHSYPVKNEMENHVFSSKNNSDDEPFPEDTFNYSGLRHAVSEGSEIERVADFQILQESASNYSNDWDVNYPTQVFGRMSKDDRKRKRLKGESYFTTGGKFVAGRQVEMVPCKCPFKCHERISNDQAKVLFAEFWSLDDIEKKRKYLAELIDSSEVKRRCKSKSMGKVDGQTKEIQSQKTSSKSDMRRTISYQYFLMVDNVRIRVCQAFFRGVLAVTEKFVRICLNKRRTSGILADMRGKHTPWNKLNEEEFHFETIPVQTVLSVENLPHDVNDSQSQTSF